MAKQKNRIQRFINPILGGVFLVVSALALASPPFMRGSDGDMFRMERMASELKLDDVQRARVEQITDDSRKRERPYARQMVEGREQLRKIIRADKFDEAAVRQAAQAQSEAMTELMVQRACKRHEMRQVLSPEQRERHDRKHRHFSPSE